MYPLPTEFRFAGFAFPRYIADLPIGFHAMRRKRELRKTCGGYYSVPAPNSNRGWGFYDDGGGSGSPFRLRIERADCGFSIDEYGYEHMYPIIARLPHGRGFLVGWTMGNGMAACLDADIFADEDNAWRAARRRCEDAAQAEYEYQQDERARIEAEELAAHIDASDDEEWRHA